MAMAAYTRREVEDRWSLQVAVGEIDGGRALGGSRLKKLKITDFQSTFDAIRSNLQGIAVSGLAVSEVYLWGTPGQGLSFYRGAEYDAPSPRVKVEMPIAEDSVSPYALMWRGGTTWH